MKLNKVKLKELIVEVLNEETEQDPTKLKAGSMTTGARVKAARDRITGDTEEFTNQEQNIIDQLEKFISNMASQPGIDLMKFRPLLQRVLKILQQQAAKSIKQPEQGEQE